MKTQMERRIEHVTLQNLAAWIENTFSFVREVIVATGYGPQDLAETRDEVGTILDNQDKTLDILVTSGAQDFADWRICPDCNGDLLSIGGSTLQFANGYELTIYCHCGSSFQFPFRPTSKPEKVPF